MTGRPSADIEIELAPRDVPQAPASCDSSAKRAHDLFLQNLVKGTTHLSLGMEAVATGFGAAMKPGDYTFATYRGHAHSLARGMDLGPALAELLGGRTGCSAARAGRCISPMSRRG